MADARIEAERRAQRAGDVRALAFTAIGLIILLVILLTDHELLSDLVWVRRGGDRSSALTAIGFLGVLSVILYLLSEKALALTDPIEDDTEPSGNDSPLKTIRRNISRGFDDLPREHELPSVVGMFARTTGAVLLITACLEALLLIISLVVLYV
jgi:hypothetical protein